MGCSIRVQMVSSVSVFPFSSVRLLFQGLSIGAFLLMKHVLLLDAQLMTGMLTLFG